MELQLNPDNIGKRELVTHSVHDVMMKHEIGGMHLWQCITPNNNGGWDEYYTNDKG